MLIVADTSPINYLILLGQDTLLHRLYNQVVVPPAVHGELQYPQTPRETFGTVRLLHKHYPRPAHVRSREGAQHERGSPNDYRHRRARD
jgi:predicted nucleic acid-binding protein